MKPSRLIEAMLKIGQAFTVTVAIVDLEMNSTNPTATTPEISPQMSPKSQSTAGTSPAVESQEDDIWGNEEGVAVREEILSDLPSMKRQHMTDGYREGLSIGKARVMQSGFDDGYPIGVQLAMRVGPVLGVLEAYLSCKSIDVVPGMRQKVKLTYDEALHDLSITNLLQNLDEETLLASKKIPEAAEAIISFWEGKVSGVYENRRSAMASQERENPYDLRESFEAAKRRDPDSFNMGTGRTPELCPSQT